MDPWPKVVGKHAKSMLRNRIKGHTQGRTRQLYYGCRSDLLASTVHKLHAEYLYGPKQGYIFPPWVIFFPHPHPKKVHLLLLLLSLLLLLQPWTYSIGYKRLNFLTIFIFCLRGPFPPFFSIIFFSPKLIFLVHFYVKTENIYPWTLTGC